MAVDFRQLEEFRNNIQNLSDEKCSKFCDDCAKELAGRLLAKVIPRTPVGVPPQDIDDDTFQEHWSGYVGGTLRRGWTGGQQVSNVKTYARGLPVNVISNEHKIEIINNVKYAMYVEYGHRQRAGRYVPALGKKLKQSWVPGKFMMTSSVRELDAQAQSIIDRKLQAFLRENGVGQ